MEINTALFKLLNVFNNNWKDNKSSLLLEMENDPFKKIDSHPLKGELINIADGKGGSIPFFVKETVIWCTLASSTLELNTLVEQLHIWIIPSFGWQESNDGYKSYDNKGDKIQKVISEISPDNYFRWRSSISDYSVIEEKMLIKYNLEKNRPFRERNRRPSLFELRTQFQMGLMNGDRDLAEHAIQSIDIYELDKALNTQMMYIRLWHHFREFDKIQNFKNLPNIQIQPSLPELIRVCINDALGLPKPKDPPDENKDNKPKEEKPRYEWDDWFDLLLAKADSKELKFRLDEKVTVSIDDLTPEQVQTYADSWDAIYVDDNLISKYRFIISEAIVIFLSDFVREPEFPRFEFASLYLSLLNLWSKLYTGVGGQREKGHVLLELANALLQLNYKIDEAKQIVEECWRERSVSSQLPFVLNAIEILSENHPNWDASGNLWIEASDIAKRNSDKILESEKKLWRKSGYRIGFDEKTINEYFPIDPGISIEDPLGKSNLKKIAIVSMRESQAKSAAEQIQERINAEITMVSEKVADKNTKKALTCDVVLFVWLATTHSVFRAFDGFDRKRLSYVQGTGSASIVRSLERWVLSDN